MPYSIDRPFAGALALLVSSLGNPAHAAGIPTLQEVRDDTVDLLGRAVGEVGVRRADQLVGGPAQELGQGAVRPDDATVVVGPREALLVTALTAGQPRWCGPAPRGPVRLGAQIRAHGEEVPAVVTVGRGAVEVTFDAPLTGVARGQSVVLYDGTRVVGSATIDATRAPAAEDGPTSPTGPASSTGPASPTGPASDTE